MKKNLKAYKTIGEVAEILESNNVKLDDKKKETQEEETIDKKLPKVTLDRPS